MKKTGVIATLLVVVLMFGVFAVVYAQQDYHDELILTYPKLKGTKIDKTCLCCHFIQEGTGPRNPYGVLYENEGTSDFAKYENEDADGDGYTNMQEINAKTYPGDFSDHPSPAKYTKCVTFFGSNDTLTKKGITVCVVNGKKTDLTPHGGASYIKGGKMMVPLRISIEGLGGTVNWIADEKRIDILKGGKVVGQMWIGKRMGKVNGKEYDLVTPPEIVKGKTFVPVKAVGDSLGAKLIWINTGKIANFVL